MSEASDPLAGLVLVMGGGHPTDTDGHVNDILSAVMAAVVMPAGDRAAHVADVVSRERWCPNHVGLLVDLTAAIIDRTMLPLTSLAALARQVSQTEMTEAE